MTKKKAKLRILDEVNCVFVGLTDETLEYFYNEFAVFAPNYYFNPKFKLGSWDGKIRFFHKTGKTFVNLLEQILPKVQAIGYSLELEDLRATTKDLPDADVHKDSWSHVLSHETGEPIELRPYQVDSINAVIENGGGIILAGTGAGKAQPLTSNILTPNGWKQMGDVAIGDVIVNPTGGTCSVIGVFPQGTKDIYEITFHDGSRARCCEDHLWQTKFPKQSHKAWTEERIVSTKDIIEFLNRKRSDLHTPGNVSIPLCVPVESPEQELPIDPYVLGLLIGDGCLKGTPLFSSKDEALVEAVRTELKPLDITPKQVTSGSCDYRLSKNGTKNVHVPNPLVSILTELNLYGHLSYSKFIPEPYMKGSVNQRLALLQGLMDTDGTADQRGNCSFSTASIKLANDVQRLCWSLGMTCSQTDRVSNINTPFKNLHIRCNTPRMLFRLARKQNRCLLQHGAGRISLTRRIVDVKFVSQEPAQCILLDSKDHLYITDDYVVTHNTLINGVLVDKYGQLGYKTITVVPSQDLIKQTYDEFVAWGLDTGEFSGKQKNLNHQHIVSTWQTLQNTPTVIQQFNVVVVDECHGLKGQVLTKLLNEHGKKIAFRFGLTGTLPKAETDKLSVHVAVGYPQYVVPAHELITQGYLATLHIDIIQLEENFREDYESYLVDWESRAFKDPNEKALTYIKYKEARFPDYPAEKSYVKTNDERLEWIAMYLEAKRDMGKGNVFCLVDGVQFGKKLAKHVSDAHFVYGKDEQKARKEIYNLFKDNDNLVIIATVNIASTGLNIKRIFNMVFIDMGKSFIRTIQSIGRGLRKADDKESVIVTDICSDLKYGKRHLAERIRFYKEAQYPYKKKVVDYRAV